MKTADNEKEEDLKSFNRFRESVISNGSNNNLIEEVKMEELSYKRGENSGISNISRKSSVRLHLNHSLSIFDKYDYEERV